MNRSWVVYSVAVYLGLMFAGSIIGPSPAPSVGADGPPRYDPRSVEPGLVSDTPGRGAERLVTDES